MSEPKSGSLERTSEVVLCAVGEAGSGKSWLLDAVGHGLALRGAIVKDGPIPHSLAVQLHPGMKA